MPSSRLNRLITVPDAFLERLPAVQRRVFEKLLERLSNLKTKDGNILFNSENKRIIESLRTYIHDELLSTDYPKAVKNFSDEFITQGNLTQSYYQQTFDTTFSTALAESSVKTIQKSVVRSLITDSVEANFLTPLENVLNIAVQSGAGFTDTVKNIREFVEGSDTTDGRILQYSKQLAHDSFANADRSYNAVVSDELGIEWYLWAGGEIATSRCFCIERHGKYYHRKEVEMWGRKEGLGDCNVGDGWAGMNRNTDEKTIFIYGGGYGCLHTVAGVSIFDVPKEDVQRNVDNGNYTPSKVEADYFGI